MKLHSVLNLTLDGGWGPDSSLMAIFPPGKEPLICIEWETLWSPETGFLACSLVTIPDTIPWLLTNHLLQI